MPQDPIFKAAEGLPDITQRPTLNTLIGGPDYYDPALGKLAVSNPEMLAKLLDAKGLRAPPDVSKDFTHRDASQALLNASVQMKQPEFPPVQPASTEPSDAQRAASQGVTFSDPSMAPGPGGPPSVPGAAAAPSAGAALDPSSQYAPHNLLRRAFTDANVTGDPDLTGIPTFSPSPPVAEPGGGFSSATPSYHRSSQDVSGPTPSPESVNSSGAVPSPATSEKPGDLSKPDPVAAAGGTGTRMTHGPGPGDQVHPDKTVDGLAKAMAGLQALTPKPFLPSTPAPYRPTGQIQRSTLPQALLAEMIGAAKPTAQFRLGEALRGKAYA